LRRIARRVLRRQVVFVFGCHNHLQRLIEYIRSQRLFPTYRTLAQVRASAVLFAGGVNDCLPVWLANQPDKLPFVLFFAANDATALRNMLGTGHLKNRRKLTGR
jgi:hypothetical protein